MISWKQISSWFKRLYFGDMRVNQNKLNRSAAYIIRYLFHVVREMSRDQCPLRSSALAFTTLMTLMPVAVLVFVIFQAVGGFDQASRRVQDFLFQHLLPESVASVQDFIQNLLSGFNVQAVSYISIIFFIGAAYSLSSSIDSSINAIWGVRKTRRFFYHLVTVWFILTVTPIFMGYSLYLTTQLEKVSLMGLGPITSQVYKNLMPYLLTLFSFILLYKMVPRTRVKWSSTLLGAFFASFVWELSKYGLNYYVRNLSNYRVLYGSFLTIPVFFIWLKISWLIVLIGAEIAYTHQNLDQLHLINKQNEKAKNNVFLLSEKLGFYVFFLVIDYFMSGKSITINQLSALVPYSGWMVDTYLDRFQKDGFLIVDQDGHIVPARDPATIRINEVFDFFQPEQPDQFWGMLPGDSAAVRMIMDELKKVRWETFSERDIRSMILQAHDKELTNDVVQR
ncbi:MAG: YihY/virulence factor BrkB family protein [bacterium]